MWLFTRYLVTRPGFRFVAVGIICALISLPILLIIEPSIDNFPAWLYYFILIPILVVVIGLIGFVIAVIIQSTSEAIIEKIKYNIMPDYKRWKETMAFPPSESELEHDKVTAILNRYALEAKLKKSNGNAAQLYKEYQILLSLTEGIEVFEDVELSKHCWPRCLKRKQDM